MNIYIKNALLLACLTLSHSLFAQNEAIEYKSYSISLQKEGQEEIQRIKIAEKEAQDFDVSSYISEHIAEYNINIWATIKSDHTQAQFRFNSDELVDNHDCRTFCEELLEIDRQPLLGVGSKDHEDFEGAVITSVVTNSGAEKAGLRENDLITFIGTTSIHTGCELRIAIRKYNVGDKISVTYVRSGTTYTVMATLGYKLIKKMTWVPCCDSPTEGIGLTKPIVEGVANSRLKLFPNPSEGASHIHFSSDLKEDIQLIVTDVNGRRVFNREFAEFNGIIDQFLDLTNEAAGIFFVTVVQGEAVFMERLVVVNK